MIFLYIWFVYFLMFVYILMLVFKFKSKISYSYNLSTTQILFAIINNAITLYSTSNQVQFNISQVIHS
jgi:hypothetical protein